MAETTITLLQGLKVGDVAQTECVLREPTAGDVIAASEAAEKLVNGPNGPELVTSPTLVGINTLLRQVVRIGDITGPLDRDVLNKLSADDLDLMQGAAVKLETASRELATRGRSDAPGEGAQASH